jgi:hypothetical protein
MNTLYPKLVFLLLMSVSVHSCTSTLQEKLTSSVNSNDQLTGSYMENMWQLWHGADMCSNGEREWYYIVLAIFPLY